MRAATILLLLAGCNKLLGIPGGGNLSGDAPGDGFDPLFGCEPDPSACALFAADREVAQSPHPITLEGTFGNVVMVEFPGGIMQNATVVGPHRAVVPVPDGVSAGELVVTTAGMTVGNVRFRGTTFPIGAAHFQQDYHQTNGAHQGVRLPTPRAFSTAHAIGRRVHVIGGDEAGIAKTDVAAAPINADGTIGRFVAGASRLNVERRRHTSVVIGRFVYVLGGQGSDLTTALGTIERAAISDDGALAAFAPVAAVGLTIPRVSATAQIIGDVLFVIGGAAGNGTAFDSIEGARIRPDGSLEPFAVVGTLAAARATHTSVVVGGSLYVIGGVPQLGGPAVASIERAQIEPDGTLGPFAIVPGVQLAAARSAHASALLGDRILVTGGTNDGNAVSSVESLMLDMQGNIVVASLSHDLSRGRAGAAAVLVDNDLHLIGGIDFTVPTTPVLLANSDHASINVGGGFDPPIIAPITTPARTRYSSPTLGDFVYVLGGEGAGGAFPNAILRAPVTADGAIGIFAAVSGAVVSNPTSSHSFVTTGAFANLLGGTSGVGTTASILESPVGPTGDVTSSFVGAGGLQSAREFSTVAAVGATLYVFAGRDGTQPSNSVEQTTMQADGKLGGFATTVSLSAPRRGHCSVVIRNKVFQIGGGIGGTDNAATSIEVCTIQPSGTISSNCTGIGGVSLTTARKEHMCVVIGNFLYVMGGLGGGGSTGAQDTIERSQITSDGNLMGFTLIGATLTTGRASARVMQLGNRLYVLGGDDGNGFILDSAEETTLR